MVVAASTLTVEAFAIANASSTALGCDTAEVSGLPPPQSPPIITLPPPAWPEASMVAPLTSMCSPLTTIVPPLVPSFLPAAESLPETFTFCGGSALAVLTWPRLPPLCVAVAALSTIMPFLVPTEFASITPEVLITESTTTRAAAAVSSTRPPFAFSLPSLETRALSVCPVATSFTWPAIWSPTPSWISRSPYMSSVNMLPDASATVPSVAVMVPVLRTPGATSAAKPPLVAVIVPWLTIEASGRPGILKLKRPAMKSSLRMSLVVARKPAVVITAPGPKMMPSRLTRNTLPFAVSVPRIWLGPSPPVTLLSTIEFAFGWTNVVFSPTPILNRFQLMIALSDC